MFLKMASDLTATPKEKRSLCGGSVPLLSFVSDLFRIIILSADLYLFLSMMAIYFL